MSEHAHASRTSPPPLREALLQTRALPGWNRLPIVGTVIAAIGLGLTLAVGLGQPAPQLWRSWLVGSLFVLTIGLGGLFVTLVHHATQAGWSVSVRRIAENAMATLPFVALLFVPLLLHLGDLFEWPHPEAAHDPLIANKAPLLNTPFFVLRTVLYFAIWSGLAIWFARQSRLQDRNGDQELTRRMRRASAPGLILFALTTTFASFDWLMGLDPHWYSTIFGIYFFSGALVATYAFMSLVAIAQRRNEDLAAAVRLEHVNVLGGLLFAFVSFWGYIGFSQYMLIWYAALPEETGFFASRLVGSWRTVTVGLVLGHFILPFFFLMPKTIKRHATALSLAAVWMLAMHALDLYWLAMPGLHPDGASPSLLDFTALVGACGLFLAAFGWASRRQALVPLRDPRLSESLVFEA